MNLLQHRELLSSWLQDTNGVQWSDARLNRVINLACREVEKHILSHDPEAFKCIYTAATSVPGTGEDNIYSFPVGTFAVHEIALSSDGLNFAKVPNISSLGALRKFKADGISDSYWTVFDSGHFILYPGAATAIASGIRCIVAPTLGMSQDSDLSPLPLAFETLHILEAKKIALWDVGEPTDNVQEEINRIKQETPRFLLINSAGPYILQPDLTRY